MNIHTLPLGPFQQNTRILFDGRAALIIDPGAQADIIYNYIRNNSLEVKAILLTHAHFDHVGALDEIREHYDVSVYMHKDEQVIFDYVPQQAKMFQLNITHLKPVTHFIEDGEILNLLGQEVHVIHTPGHTPGGVCYYFKNESFVVVGDTLFLNSIGRTDLPGGNYEQIIDSIKSKLLTLPESTVVMSGHGDNSLIGNEKRGNPFLQ